MKPVLHTIAIQIFDFCSKNNIELSIEWIPRTLNQKADAISKFVDIDDWQLTVEFFRVLDVLWGPHTVDCFANYYNRKTPKFFSRFWNPGTSGVDAFYQSWKSDNCLLVPPVDLICTTLRKMECEYTKGTLIVPDWPSSSFWPLLWGHCEKAIIDVKRYKGKEVLMHGRNVKSIFGSPDWEGYVYAVRLSFDIIP